MSNEDDQYIWWRRRLAGETIATHDGHCEAGFYRSKRKDGSSEAVAIWYAKDGALRCRVGSENVSEQRARDLWTYVSQHPVSHDDYKAKIETGDWPDQSAAVSRSNQAPPDDSFEGLRDTIDDLTREAERMIAAGGAKTKAAADQASDLANKLGELWKKADNARKVEKAPIDEAARAVQTKWQPILDAANIYKRLKSFVITPFLVDKAEAEKKVAEAFVRAGKPLPPQPEHSTTKAGTRGRSVALRTVRQAVVVDRDALIAALKDGAAMSEFLQQQADRAVRAGVDLPGVKVEEQQVAA